MNILYIYNSENNVTLDVVDTVFSYCLNAGTVNATGGVSLNDGDRLNALALELKADYSTYIYALNNKFIKSNLIWEENLSLYFVSDLANKRTEIFDTYVSICHLFLIKEKMRDRVPQKIVVDGCSEEFIEALSSLFINAKIERKNCAARKNFSFFKSYIVAIYFFIDTLLKRMLLNVVRWKDTAVRSIERVIFTIFPLHLDDAGFDQKYGAFVKKEDCYLVSIIMDGMHQWRSLTEYVRDIAALKQMQRECNIILLDYALTFKDILRGCGRIYVLQKQKRMLKRNVFIFKNVNITGYVHYEIDISLKRIQRLLMYANAVQKIFSQYAIKSFYYYLHEYSFGRFLTFMLSFYFPDVSKIGFQHGPASRRKLLYALAPEEAGVGHNCINHLPLPDSVLCEDVLSKKIYESYGYQNVEIMDEVPRLFYLKNISRENVINNTILIACGLHDGPELFQALKSEIVADKEHHYIIKFHPKMNAEKISAEIGALHLDNLEIARKHIAHYFAFVAEVISSYSSVGYEAYLLGIKTRVVRLNNKINESPLLDIETKVKDEEVSCVYH